MRCSWPALYLRPASGGVEIDLGWARRGGQRSPCPSNAPQALLTGGPVQPVGHPAGGHQPELRCEIKLFCHVHSVIRGCDSHDLGAGSSGLGVTGRGGLLLICRLGTQAVGTYRRPAVTRCRHGRDCRGCSACGASRWRLVLSSTLPGRPLVVSRGGDVVPRAIPALVHGTAPARDADHLSLRYSRRSIKCDGDEENGQNSNGHGDCCCARRARHPQDCRRGLPLELRQPQRFLDQCSHWR